MKYKREYVILVGRVAEIINRYDPLGFNGLEGPPDNEYTAEAPLIVANLKFCKKDKDTAYLLQDAINQAYGTSFDLKTFNEMSKEIWSAYKDYLGESK